MKLHGIILLVFLSYTAICQEGDYYRLPKERNMQDGRITLPNVNTQDIFLYITAKGGYKLQGSNFSDNSYRQLSKDKSNNLFWQAGIGLNVQDTWGLELTYLSNPLFLKWQYSDLSGYNYPVVLSQETPDHSLLLFFKRKLFTVDRVTRKTRLNLLLGTKYSLASADKSTISAFDFGAAFYYGPNQAQIVNFKSTFTRPKAQLAPVLGTELSGRLAESIEIGVMAYYVFETKNGLASSIEVNSPSGNQIKSDLLLSKQSVFMGVTFRWNFHHGIRYISETL
ncbi:hypothetical protein LAG90_16460 [Marinilongibacter aquaticus]|uniref:hypothetical protein n=1 Tax=Marinilongibacter aquaticus TaxID=2975157 RepID=UPI0021BD5FC5|nr:hypothetical protein [Marinilongibacter aquaticus]UBM58398.1 hypothetical protein LAG90_16460 [Marinilongibacter aquaticus]